MSFEVITVAEVDGFIIALSVLIAASFVSVVARGLEVFCDSPQLAKPIAMRRNADLLVIW